jgi:putative NIF3 family GTP cyclohydrolase 1 type 2
MVNLKRMDKALDELFRYREIGTDPAFSRFIPMVYDTIQFPWRDVFEREFNQLFNGFMIKGKEEAGRIFLAVFPTEEVLSRFITESNPGDLLFMHHPLVMECGDPQGEWGRGFIPIDPQLIEKIKEKQLSVFTLHVPLDYSPLISTSDAMAEALGATVIKEFFKDNKGACGRICEIPSTSTAALVERLKEIFHIPYADVEGPDRTKVTKIAVVAGCGDKVDAMKEAERFGVEVYISGEIHCHIDNDYGRKKFAEMKDYIKETSMSLIGVSHGSSEYLVHASQLKPWFEKRFQVPVTLLPQKRWWV